MALQAQLLREHFQAISFKADRISEYFYDNLFTNYPAVRPMFQRVRMEEQRKKLVHALAVILRNIDNEKFLSPYLQGLGLSHVAYGAVEDHYAAVGESLLKALEQVSGDLWNDELASAWTDAFGAVADIMKQGAAIADNSTEEAA